MLLLALLLAAEPTSKVTAADISGHIRFLADDLLEGRKPATRGSELAIRYLATELESIGLRPGGENGTFYQSVPMVELKAQVPREVQIGAAFLHAGGGVSADLV